MHQLQPFEMGISTRKFEEIFADFNGQEGQLFLRRGAVIFASHITYVDGTLCQTNMEAKNGSLEEDFPFQKGDFQIRILSSQGVGSCLWGVFQDSFLPKPMKSWQSKGTPINSRPY